MFVSGREAGRMLRLDVARYVIGRGGGATIAVDDDGISRRHFELVVAPSGTVMLTDLGSRNGTKVNEQRVHECAVHDGDRIQCGSGTVLQLSYHDVQEADVLQRQYDQATRDPVTRCYNRAFFMDRLRSEYAFAERHNVHLSLMLVDIEQYRRLNENHRLGDKVLRETTAVLLGCLRAEDILARYGGGEFIVLLRGTNHDSANVAADRLRRALDGHDFEFEGEKLHVKTAVGVACYFDGRPFTEEELIRQAQQHLHESQDQARSRSPAVGSAPSVAAAAQHGTISRQSIVAGSTVSIPGTLAGLSPGTGAGPGAGSSQGFSGTSTTSAVLGPGPGRGAGRGSGRGGDRGDGHV